MLNLVFLIWVISATASGSGHATGCGTLDQQACDAAKHVGTGIAVGIIFFFWAALDLILGIIWLVTRSTKRQCPVCGNNVKKGVTECSRCGHDFRAAAHANGSVR